MSTLAHQPLEFDECECENCRFFTAMEPLLAKHRDSLERRRANHMLKALRLAPNLETFEALMADQAVPPSRLHPQWRKAYGL